MGRASRLAIFVLHGRQPGSVDPLHSSLVSFFSCSISCQICKLPLKVTQELIRGQSLSKRQQKNEARIRWHRDINMGDLQWWKQGRMERELQKATAGTKQATVMSILQIKWSQDEVVGVKRDAWTQFLIPLQTVKADWLNLPLQTVGLLRQKCPSAHPPTYTPVTSFFCGGSITPGLAEHLTQINRGASRKVQRFRDQWKSLET